MQPQPTQRYFLSLLLAILLHIGVIGFVLYSLSHTATTLSMPTQAVPAKQDVVQAVTVDQAAVEQEMQRISQQEAAKQAAHAAKQAALRKEQRAAAEQQRRTARALAALKAQQQQLAHQRQQQQQLQQQVKRQQARLQQQRAQQALQQQLAAQQQAQANADQARVNSIVAKYNALILSAIRPNFIVNSSQQGLSADVIINLAPSGNVLNVSIDKSSGSAAFDRAAVSAVYKSSPLPVPTDADAFALFKRFKLTLKPQQIS